MVVTQLEKERTCVWLLTKLLVNIALKCHYHKRSCVLVIMPWLRCVFFFFFFVPDGLRGLGEVGNHDAGSTSRWTMTLSIGPALVCVWRTVFVHHDQRPFLTQEKTPGEVYRKPVWKSIIFAVYLQWHRLAVFFLMCVIVQHLLYMMQVFQGRIFSFNILMKLANAVCKWSLCN